MLSRIMVKFIYMVFTVQLYTSAHVPRSQDIIDYIRIANLKINKRVYSLRVRFMVIPACIFRNLDSGWSVSVKQFE